MSLDVAHEYHESPGTHNGCYGVGQVREVIDFHRRNLNIPDDSEHKMLR